MTEPNVLHRVLSGSGAITRRRNKLKRGVYRLIHNNILTKSGRHTLKKCTKTQVRNQIKHTGSFHGFLCGNRVAPSHIAEGWHLGVEINCDSIDAFNEQVDRFELGLDSHTPELGKYAHYYKIVDVAERNELLKRQYARA